MTNLKTRFFIILGITFFTLSCSGDLNLFSIEDDKALGEQVDSEIQASTSEYPILDSNEYSEAYAHLERIRDAVLNTGEVAFANDFLWEVYIIQDDDTLNAFATPGGYLYFYTGLMKFLDSEDELAGVMAHEIAHAAERHSTDALTRSYGIALLLDIALGEDQNTASDIAVGLASLSFSRDAETEADTKSVQYLAKTDYDCTGAAGFFEKVASESQPPEFLSTHPSPGNRVENIESQALSLNCSTTPSTNNYQDLLETLP